MCFVRSEHCIAEYNGDAVVLYPKAAMCSVDGIPISEPTRLPQGTKCLCTSIFEVFPFLPCTFYPPRTVQIVLIISACESAIRRFRQVRLLRKIKRHLTEHISASDHVTQIGSLVQKLTRDQFPHCNPYTSC